MTRVSSSLLIKSLLKQSPRFHCQSRYVSCLSQLSYHESRRNGVPRDIIFYGTDEFSLASLEKLVQQQQKYDIHVVTGQQSLVFDFAHQHKLPISVWPDTCLPKSFDVGLVVSFGHLIPREDIVRCKYGILNVHGSLLPRWRGASPIHHAILAGDEITGITIMRIKAEKFDVGDIVKQVEYRIPERATTPLVYDALSVLGAETLVQTLEDLEGAFSSAQPQPKKGITKAPKPKKEDGHIIFQTMTASEVDRRVRSLEGLVTVYCEWINGFRLKLFDVVDPSKVETFRIDEIIEDTNAEPGSIFYHRKRRLLCFKCCDMKWIAFESVSLQGRKRMSSLSFFNGFMNPLIRNNCQPKLIKIQQHFISGNKGS